MTPQKVRGQFLRILSNKYALMLISEGPRSVILVNSRGFALWSFIFRRSKKPNPREFTRLRPLRLSKYHAPGSLQNANPREFTRFRPLRLSKYHAPGHLQNANPCEFTRFKPLRPSKYHAPGRRQNANPR